MLSYLTRTSSADRLAEVMYHNAKCEGTLNERRKQMGREHSRSAKAKQQRRRQLKGGGGGGASDDDDGKAVFAAKSRRQVRIPGFVFAVSPAVVNGEDADALAALEAAVASGATAVILADDTGDATTRELFNAALALKESLRGRA